MIETIIFDGEGVVVDTEGVWDKGQEEFLRRHGFDYDRARTKPLLTGRSVVEGVKILQEEYGFGGDIQAQAHERIEIVSELFETEVGFISGFKEFFESICNDYKTCIATAMDPALFALLDVRLGLRDLFAGHIYTLDDVSNRSKPHPDLFLHAAKDLESRPDQCLVIEDAPHGIEAAHRAGMKCFAIATTYRADELSDADAVLRDFLYIDLRWLPYGEYRPVYRYTVDNRYGDDVIVMVKAPLKKGRTSFTDDTRDWEDETVVTARPKDLLDELAILGKNEPVDADLRPGRVFLRGRFEAVPADAPTSFNVSVDAPERWLCIDDLPLVKDELKSLYSKLLVESDPSAKRETN